MVDVALIPRFWFFWFSLQYFFNPGNTHLVIYVSQQSGQDTSNCLRNDMAISCKSLGYAFNGITTDNETFVDIIFKDQVYHVKELLVIDLPEERNLRLRISSGLERKSNVSLICSNYSTGIFEVNGPNLNLEFHHITFENCINVKTVFPVIVVNNTESISIFSCTFQNNWSTGLFAINSAVRIENCKFENNSVDNVNRSCGKICSISYVLGGAVGILFNNEKRNMSVDIFHSQFIQNSVHVNNERYYASNKDPNNVTVRGGAIHITLGGKTSFLNTVRINECQFERNLATLGGALHIQLLDNSMNNNIEITASKFLSNYGAQVGGAFLMSLWDQSAKTTLTMTDVLIEKNWSKSGSGIYIFLKSQGIVSDISGKRPFLFRRVHLHNNAGPTGSAVKIVSPLFGRRPIRVIPVFEDCTFENNTNVPFNNYGYMASFITDRVDINFTGTNVFYGNKYFGAAFFSSSLVHVHGKLHFIENNGNKGGALYLENSQIILHPGTNVLFQNNHADIFGGAINVVSNANIYHVAVVNNPECFITYSEKDASQNNWNASIHFINNTAALKGPAINIDSLILCSWDKDSQSINFHKSLKWKSTFFYEGNVVCQDNNFLQCQQSNGTIKNYDVISTDAASLVEKNSVKNLKICPGEAAFLDIAAYDELDKPVFTLINDISPNTSGLNTEWLAFKPQLYIVKPQEGTQVEFQYTLNGKFKPHSNASAKLYFYDISNPPVYVEFTISQVTCRPGFLQKDNTCVCDKSKTGVIGCSVDGHYVQIKEGYWAGLVDNKFTVMPCPFGYCKCPKQPNTTAEISGCSFHSVNYDDSLVCANNRHGYLCGQCQENFTVGIQSFKCVPHKKNATCTWTSIISVLLTILICALVLYCNPGLDNEFRGPLFFFQVLPIFFPPVTYSTTHETEVYNLVFFISSIFDFTIPFFSYFISDCYVIDGADNLTMLALGYSSSVLAFLVSFVAFILSCQRKILIRRKNAVQCFWVLLIFMYTSLIKTSLRILDCPPIQGKLRLFAQASVICYQDDHLAMAVFAIIVMVFCGLIIPLLIILMTASSFFRFDPHYIDTLTNKLKPECLWWWAVDLLRRLLVVILDVYIPFWNHKQVSLVFASVVILSIHCYFQPYQQRRANITEAVFLLVLCGVAAFQLLDISDEEQGKMNMGIVCVMLSYSALVVICKLVALVIRRKTSSTPNIMEYENLEETEPTTTVTTINYEESVEERRERIDALFSRSLTASVNYDNKSESSRSLTK